MQFTSVEVNIYPQNYHISSSISKYNITSQKNVFVIFNSTEIFFFKVNGFKSAKIRRFYG